MGTSGKSVARHRSPVLRPAVVLLGGAVCAAVAGTTPAHAQDRPDLATTPAVSIPHSPGVAQVFAPAAGPFGVMMPPGVPLPEFTPPVAPDPATVLNAALAAFPSLPGLPLPVPVVTDPAAPQAEEIQVGSIRLDRPSIVTPEQAAQVNTGAGEVQDGLSDVIAAQGVDRARSDEMAAQMIGDSLIGAAIGGAAIAPVAAAAGVALGGVVGFVFGIPFLPTGLVVGPVVGATLVAAMIAAPAVLAGAVIGAGAGAVEGWNAPLPAPPAA